ncbi:MAG: AbrB family transcriptional regulator [Geminicoccaceae bacterium]|nr:AbrB family transcriptional regulator [Geminicoccaceae bacterium]
MPFPNALKRTLLTLALGALGGYLLSLAGFPAAWLAGSMAAVAVAALLGLRVGLPERLREIAFILLGISMGSAVTPDSLHRMAAWPMSLLILVVCVAATALLGSLWLERRHGWSRATARFSAIPGALSYILALAIKSPADVPRVATAQSLRLVVLVAVMPLLVQLGGEVDPTAVLSRPAGGTPLGIAVLVALATAGGFALKRLNVPAGLLMGSLLASALLHGSGLVEARLPGPLLVPGFVVMGGVIGGRFANTRPADLLRLLRPSLESVGVGLLVSAAFAFLAARLLALPFGQVWLAYAPGGVEAMTVMAFALHVDPAFVGAHHFFRLLALSVAIPLWMRPVLKA